MSIVTLAEVLDFCNVDKGYFIITASNDILKLKYDGGAVTDIDIDDGTYEGDDLAAELKTKIDTAFTIASTVTYSSTTKKFSIAVTAGHTIAYINSGSDAGLTLGFDQDHAAALSITSDLAANDPSSILESIQTSVEKWAENYCHRKFEAALYVKERHDGNRQEIIYFDQYPVLAINLDGLVWDATGKTVTRNDGGSFIDDGFAAGDKVLVQNSDDNSGLLTIATAGVAALILTFTDTIISDTEDDNVILSLFRELWINDDEVDEDDYEVNTDHIYYNSGFSEGHKNVRLTYYAGYSADNMPEDLKLAIKIICKNIYQKREEEIFGIRGYSVGDIRTDCESGDVPKEALNILDSYKKVFIV